MIHFHWPRKACTGKKISCIQKYLRKKFPTSAWGNLRVKKTNICVCTITHNPPQRSNAVSLPWEPEQIFFQRRLVRKKKVASMEIFWTLGKQIPFTPSRGCRRIVPFFCNVYSYKLKLLERNLICVPVKPLLENFDMSSQCINWLILLVFREISIYALFVFVK